MPYTFPRLVIGLLFTILAAGCGGDDDEAPNNSVTNLCGRDPRVFDDAADLATNGVAPCFGDTILARLAPDGDARTAEFPIDIPKSGTVRICLDLIDDHPHVLELHDAGGAVRARVVQGSGCADADVAAGRHTMRLTNGRPREANAYGYLVFVHPLAPSEAQAQGTNLLGAYAATSSCANCNLDGADFSGTTWLCSSTNCEAPNQFCNVATTKNPALQFGVSNDFSGSSFAGANFNGALFQCVNFHGAQFWNDQHGAASMQVGPTCCHQGYPPGAPKFSQSSLRGASLRNMDLTVADFTCSVVGDAAPYFEPANLSGADLRGANMGNVDYSTRRCPTNPNSVPLNLSGAIVDTTTNLKGTDLSGANLSEWDMRQAHWTNAILKHTMLDGAIFDGIDFTKAPYDTIFVSGANTNGILAGANLSSASFIGATLTNAVIEYTIFRANFTRADLTSATFVQKDLRGTNFTFADLQTAQMPNVFLGVADEQYTQDPTLAANLSFAYMPGANLDHADLRHANFSSVHLYGTPATVSGALMGNASFDSAILSGLNLKAAQLQNTNFQNAQLVGCPFNNATVTNANFAKAHLEGADFTGANMASAQLTNAALSRRGDFGTYTNQVLVYSGTQWTCQPSSSQKWCGKPTGFWSYTEPNTGIPYTITFTETVLDATPTTICPNTVIGGCTTVDQLTPIVAPFPPVPDCVPSATNWCTPNAGTTP